MRPIAAVDQCTVVLTSGYHRIGGQPTSLKYMNTRRQQGLTHRAKNSDSGGTAQLAPQNFSNIGFGEVVTKLNVFPNELENVISLCPGVMECAAVGVADNTQGEAIKVFVVRSDPLLTEDDVAAYCKHNLTGYKRPKYIEFRDDLPKSNVGKILRRELRSAH